MPAKREPTRLEPALGEDGEMALAHFRIVGLSPVLMHNPGMMGVRNEGPATKHIPTPEEEAEAGTYRLKTGQLYLPADHFRGSAIGAGRGLRLGTKSAAALIAASTFIAQEVCPLVHPDTGEEIHEYEVDLRRAVVQRQAVMRARPKIMSWATEVGFFYEPDFMRPDLLEEFLQRAGRIVGVGDYRPQKGGPYGRFTATLIPG